MSSLWTRAFHSMAFPRRMGTHPGSFHRLGTAHSKGSGRCASLSFSDQFPSTRAGTGQSIGFPRLPGRQTSEGPRSSTKSPQESTTNNLTGEYSGASGGLNTAERPEGVLKERQERVSTIGITIPKYLRRVL